MALPETITSTRTAAEHRTDHQSLHARHNQVFNVKEYGALGDGTTDDQTACQAALTAAAASGGVVYFPRGTYRVIGLTYGSNVTVAGDGPQSVISLKAGMTTPGSWVLLAPTTTGITDATIRDLTLDQRYDLYPNNTTAPCLSVNATTRVTVSGVTFYRSQTMAVWCDSTAAAPTTGMVIDNCRIRSPFGGGFSFFGALTDFRISNNVIDGCYDDAIALQEGLGASAGQINQRGVVVGNTVTRSESRNPISSTPHAILTFGSKDVAITGNTVYKTVASGIYVSNATTVRSENITVSGNTVRDAGITAATTTGIPGHGIDVRNSDAVTVTGNTVIGSRQSGIACTTAKRVTVVGNICQSNANNGVRLEDTVDSSVTGNTIMDNGSGGGETWGVTMISTSAAVAVFDCVIVGNRIGDSRTGAARTQTHAIYIGLNSDRIMFANNNYRNNLTGFNAGVTPTTFINVNNQA